MQRDFQERAWSTDIHDVVIVYPFTYVNPFQSLPPIAAEYLQAGAVEAGCKTTLLDMRFESDIRAHLERADMVCIYGYFEDCSIFGKWDIHVIAEVLEQIPDGTPVVAGGTGFSIPEEAMETYPRVDVVMRGIPDSPIRELLAAGSPEKVDNLTYRANGEVVTNPRAVRPLSNDVYPRRHLRNPRYVYQALGVPVDLVRGAVGCNYRCKFCYEYGKDTDGSYLRWQTRSAESHANELGEIEAPLILWIDDDMTTDMDNLDRMADLIIERGIQKVMIGTGRIDHVIAHDVSTLHKLERAGLFAIAIGVESLKDETLKFYKKAQKVSQVQQAMGMISETNIHIVCNFLLGSPGDTADDMLEFLYFARRFDVDTIVTNRLKIREDTDLFHMTYDEQGRERPGLERVQGEELARIKAQIKFGQRTPFRIALTILKMFRHRGLFLDPMYLFCCFLETATRYTWIEKTRLVPIVLWIPKRIALLGVYRSFTRLVARVLTPPVRGLNWLFEALDRRVNLSTKVMPRIFGTYSKIQRKQKARAQNDPAVAAKLSREMELLPAAPPAAVESPEREPAHRA